MTKDGGGEGRMEGTMGQNKNTGNENGNLQEFAKNFEKAKGEDGMTRMIGREKRERWHDQQRRDTALCHGAQKTRGNSLVLNSFLV